MPANTSSADDLRREDSVPLPLAGILTSRLLNRDKDGAPGSPRSPRAMSPLKSSPSSPSRTPRTPVSPDGRKERYEPANPWWLKPEPLIIGVCLLLALVFVCTRIITTHKSGFAGLLSRYVPEEQAFPDHGSWHGGPPLQCSAEQADLQVQEFRTRSIIESACSEHGWVGGFQAIWPAGHKVILDIGCNLGYMSAEFFDSFVPELGVNKKSLYEALAAEPESARCNVCDSYYYPGECQTVHKTPPLPAGQSRSVEVHSFEPGDIHFPRLLRSRDKLFGVQQHSEITPRKVVNHTSGRWYLHNLAVSNYSGRAAFTKGCINGQCALQDRGKGDYIVQVTTVDEFMAAQQLTHIDIMKIDTEGFDPAVLQGAKRLLASRQVSAFLFEYHKLNAWNTTQLKDVVAWLEELGYVCYFEGRPFLYKLSRSCWDNRYEVKQWTNVACGLANGPIERLLDTWTYLRVIQSTEKGTQVKPELAPEQTASAAGTDAAAETGTAAAAAGNELQLQPERVEAAGTELQLQPEPGDESAMVHPSTAGASEVMDEDEP